MLTAHYSAASGFLADEQILGDLRSGILRDVPCVAVHGANDLICPPSTAYEIHRAWPGMEVRLVTGGGHSMYDGGLQSEVLDATDAFADAKRRAPPRDG